MGHRDVVEEHDKVAEDVVVELHVVLVVFAHVIEKGPEGPCCVCRYSCRLELDHIRPDAQFVQVVRPALHHVPPCR